MKPGDLVIINMPDINYYQNEKKVTGKTGFIVKLATTINGRPMWEVLVENELYEIREIHLLMIAASV